MPRTPVRPRSTRASVGMAASDPTSPPSRAPLSSTAVTRELALHVTPAQWSAHGRLAVAHNVALPSGFSASSASRCVAWQAIRQPQPPAVQVSRPPFVAPQVASRSARGVPVYSVQ